MKERKILGVLDATLERAQVVQLEGNKVDIEPPIRDQAEARALLAALKVEVSPVDDRPPEFIATFCAIGDTALGQEARQILHTIRLEVAAPQVEALSAVAPSE